MQVPKARVPHPDIGCWWTLYDYGPERVKAWEPDYKHPYPGASHRGTRFTVGGCWSAVAVVGLRHAEPARLTCLLLSPHAAHRSAEALKRSRDAAERKKEKQEKKKARAAAEAEAAEAPARPSVPATPIAFLFPGQGSQAVGMLKVCADGWRCGGS